MGLFGIIKEKIRNQGLLAPTVVSPMARVEPYQKGFSSAMGARHMQILQESMDLLHKTVYPGTFFSRYKVAIREATLLADICCGEDLGDVAEEALDTLEYDKEEIVADFLKRCAASGKLPSLKDELLAHRSEMPAESLLLLRKLLNEAAGRGNNTEVILCKVVFQEGGKAYYYLSDYKEIRVGDRVCVPVGRENKAETGRVTQVTRCRADAVPIPASSLKKILRILK